jgi:SAM-dependent methyltransferase
MATSYSSQIPAIIHLISSLKPTSVLDIGKGFGKYGFLLHEYYGVDHSTRPRPALALCDQSRVMIDAVECNPNYLWPHLGQLYRTVVQGRIEELYKSLPYYDVVLMADVIEHLREEDARSIVRHFLERGSTMVISTPRVFFQQDLFESADEHHISYWTAKDFRKMGHCDYQNSGAGRIFLVSPRPLDVRGFGHAPIKRLRRLARAVQDELLP